jgi:hypothetical protein
VKKLQALGGKIGGSKGDTRDIAARTGDACLFGAVIASAIPSSKCPSENILNPLNRL